MYGCIFTIVSFIMYLVRDDLINKWTNSKCTDLFWVVKSVLFPCSLLQKHIRMDNLNHTYFLFCYFRLSNQIFFLSSVQSPYLFFFFFISIYFFAFNCSLLGNSNNFEIVMTEWEHVTNVFIISVSQVFPKSIWPCVGSLYMSFSGLSKRFSHARKLMSICFAINGHWENNDSDVHNP